MHPTGSAPGTSTSEWIPEILNAGGLASNSLFLVQEESQLLAGGTALPNDGTTHMRLTFRQEIQGGAILQPNLLIIAAKDVQGDWWDCVQGVRIEDLQTWWADQLNSLDLPIIGLEESPDGLTVRALGGH